MRIAAAAGLVSGPHAARAPLLHGPQHADHALDAPAGERAAPVAPRLHAPSRGLLLQVSMRSRLLCTNILLVSCG